MMGNSCSLIGEERGGVSRILDSNFTLIVASLRKGKMGNNQLCLLREETLF